MKIEATVEIVTKARSLKQFRRAYPTAEIKAIDGRLVFAFCESCSGAIFVDEPSYSWDDGVYTCIDCGGADVNHKVTPAGS